MIANQIMAIMRKEGSTMRDLLMEIISIATLIAKDMYNLEIEYVLEVDSVTFICRDKSFKVEVTESKYVFIDIDAFEFVCIREEFIEKEFYQLFSYHINYWLREIRKDMIFYVL